ncbi:MAG TPA: hypothetical protein VNZ64_16090 [Candidatus Acidoferrum sp.]|jgi:hypothetical protein|nr:hypothetical protein [Candidatus Acidoferrum sp.]
MKTRGINSGTDYTVRQVWSPMRQTSCRPGRLHLVTVHEVEDLRDELARGNVPPDLEAKLCKLGLSELGHRFIEQQCRTIIGLIQAAQAGSFKVADRAEFERLVRVLAYVRKDDDAIPDYQSDGFADDREEVRSAATELSPLLHAFKAWRLQHQVPAMWTPFPGAEQGQETMSRLASAGRPGGHFCGR